MESKKYYTVIDLAKKYKFCRWAIYKLIERGTIKAEKFGQTLLIPAESLESVKLVKHGKRYWLEKIEK